MLMEIQALVCKTNFGMPRRTAAGLDYNRVNLLMAVLEKRLGLPLSGYDAYVNIAGGIRLNEPAADLGIVLAIASSYKNRPIAEDVIVFGEVGLSGEVRAGVRGKETGMYYLHPSGSVCKDSRKGGGYADHRRKERGGGNQRRTVM